MLQVVVNSSDTVNITITPSKSKILFAKIGQLIPDVSFVTIATKINLTSLIHENQDMCQTAQKLDYQLKKKLENCVVEGKGKRDECLKPTQPETVEEYLTIPWKSEYKKKMLKAIIAEMVNLCSSSQTKLEEISNTFQLGIHTDTQALQPENSSNFILKRNPRQLITGIAIGVLTSFVSSFTSSQLFGMSQSDDYAELEENQNHIITAIQSHESRIERDESQMKQMKQHLDNIDLELASMIRQSEIFSEATAASIMARDFVNHVSDIQNGLYSLMKNKLSPLLIPVSTIEKALNQAANVAGKKGFVLAISNPIDTYQVETNFVSYNQSITILTHIPVMRPTSLVDLYRYIKTPFNIENSEQHVTIEPEESIIAVNNDHSLYISMTEDQLNQCSKLHDKLWCPASHISKKSSKRSCIQSLYRKDEKEIRETCDLHAISPDEFLFQISENKFYGFVNQSSDVFITCEPKTFSSMQRNKYSDRVKGFFMINMPNSCHGVLPKHVFATVNHMKTFFEVKYESFFIDFKSLFQGVNINEREIAKFISQTSSTGKPIRIADVLKKFGLHRLNHKNRVTSVLIYAIFGIISLLVILFCVIYFKRRQSKKFRRPVSLPHT